MLLRNKQTDERQCYLAKYVRLFAEIFFQDQEYYDHIEKRFENRASQDLEDKSRLDCLKKTICLTFMNESRFN